MMREEKFVPIEKELGTKLMKLRGEKTQEVIAAAIGVKRETIKQWENAERHIKAVDLVKLSTHYRVSVDYLLGLSDKPSLSADVKCAQEALGLSNEAVAQIVYIKDYLSQAGTLDVLNKILEADNLTEILTMILLERKRTTKAIQEAVLAIKELSCNKTGDKNVDYAVSDYMMELERNVEFAAYKAGQYFNEVIAKILRVEDFEVLKALTSILPSERKKEADDAEE